LDSGPSPLGYLATSLTGCTAVIVERCVKDAKLEVESMKVKSTIAYSPRGISSVEGYKSNPWEAIIMSGSKSTLPTSRSKPTT
jgi:hypothetical protein